MKRTMLRLLAATALMSLSLAAPVRAADGDAMVSILHAVPGATVDVYANGDLLPTNFKPGTLTDPVASPTGTSPQRPPSTCVPGVRRSSMT